MKFLFIYDNLKIAITDIFNIKNMRGIFIDLSDDLPLITAQNGYTYKALFNGYHGARYTVKIYPYQEPIIQENIKIYGVAELVSSR